MDWIQEAEQARRKDDPYRALYCYQQSLEENPHQPDVWLQAVEISFGLLEYDVRRKFIDKALQYVPDHPDILVSQARYMEREPAMAQLQRVLNANPSHREALIHLIKQDQDDPDQDDPPQPLALLERLLEIDKDSPERLLNTARRLWREGLEQPFLERFFELNPDNPALWLAAAKLMDTPQQELRCIEHALELDPTYKPAWTQQVLWFHRQGADEKAWSIPIEKTTFRLEVSLLEFLRIGKYGPIQLGMYRHEVQALLGKPENYGGDFGGKRLDPIKHGLEAFPIWEYGNFVEFHFWMNQRLFLIHADRLTELHHWGDIIRLDGWIFDRWRPPNKAQLIDALDEEHISFRYEPKPMFGQIILGSGVAVGYEYDEVNSISAISLYNEDFM